MGKDRVRILHLEDNPIDVKSISPNAEAPAMFPNAMDSAHVILKVSDSAQRLGLESALSSAGELMFFKETF